MTPTRHPEAPRRRPRALPGALLAVLLLSGCTREDYAEIEWLRFGFPAGITTQARDILALWQGSTVAALAVGVFVWGLIFWAVLRYRKRSDELPRQVRYNLPIEVLYTVVPFVIIGVLFYWTTVVQNDINKLSKDPDVVIGIVGFQWNWQFNYVDEDIQVTGRPGEPAEMVLPTDRTIRFLESSPDVIHSWFVPAFLFKRDVIPGRVNQFEVTIEEEGTFVGRCAEFCGIDHDRMEFQVRVVSPEEYDRFLEERRGSSPGAGSDVVDYVGNQESNESASNARANEPPDPIENEEER